MYIYIYKQTMPQRKINNFISDSLVILTCYLVRIPILVFLTRNAVTRHYRSPHSRWPTASTAASLAPRLPGPKCSGDGALTAEGGDGWEGRQIYRY